MAKKKENELIEFKAGDKVKLNRPVQRKAPKRIGGLKESTFFAAFYNGHEGAVHYNTVYQVSAKDDVHVVDNTHRPFPYISKDFVNQPVFNSLFTAVKSPDNTHNKED